MDSRHDVAVDARRVEVGCTFTYAAEIPTATVFQVEPHRSARDGLIDAQWSTDPQLAMHGYHDVYDNPCQRTVLPTGGTTLSYRAHVDVPDATEDVDTSAPEVSPADLPDDVLLFTVPSRYCLPDVLGTHAWREFADVAPGYGRVQAICDYVHQYLTFQYGTSTATTTAADVFLSGYGVCRDYAHLAITFCRALNIPARYVFGYLPEIDVEPKPHPMDFAAWMEVWLGDRWWTFDPRNNERRKGRVLIGRGRDASDVAMATTYGGPRLEEMVVVAHEVPR